MGLAQLAAERTVARLSAGELDLGIAAAPRMLYRGANEKQFVARWRSA
jgi:hypothetical protein